MKVLGLACAAAAHGLSATRRGVLLAPVLAPVAAAAAEQPMTTASDIGSYAALTGESSTPMGVGTMAGKSRPVTGCVLVEAPRSAGATVSADLVLRGGSVATVAFDAPGLKLAKGFYYDVEARDKLGDSSYVQVVKGGGGASGAAIADAVLRRDGRYGAFGPPTNVKVVSDGGAAPRVVEIAFSAITPGGTETPRRAAVAVAAAPGSDDAVVLVSSASETRWKGGGDALARTVSSTFRVEATRATKLAVGPASDYRYEERGGLRLPDIANPLDGFSTEPGFGSSGSIGGKGPPLGGGGWPPG